ncbi:MAG: sugar transferase [Candidatus Riflebacteria bacterium]|nr:sugar transferase [Candidatus Riflebacteria bacterium]
MSFTKARCKIRLRQSAEWIFTLLLVLLDLILVNGIFINVFDFWLTGVPNKDLYLSSYFHVRPWLFSLFVMFGIVFDVFRIRAFRAASDIIFHTGATFLCSFLTFSLMISLYRPFAALAYTFPRPILMLSTFVAIIGTFFTRAVLSSVFVPHPLLLRVLIIGDEDEGKRIIKHFHRRGGYRCKLLGVFGIQQQKEVAAEVIYRQIDEVIVTDSKTPLDDFWGAIFRGRNAQPHDFRVRYSFDPGSAAGNIGLRSLEDLPLQTIQALPVKGFSRFLKRMFDLVFSVFAIILTSPIMILTALIIKLDSPGPVFFRQKRVGRFGKEFDVVKFRSMKVGAERESGPKIATANDPRSTRIGRFLRKSGIDELPQFFLVLIGEMSVVGPRPERPFFVDKHIEFQGRRLSVRPGVTGLAAVNSRFYLRLTDKVAYDLYYLDQYSILLDIKIVFQTVWVVFFKFNESSEGKR